MEEGDIIMLYVGRKKGNKFGVIDTNDGVCEYISSSKLKELVASGISIKGVSQDHIEVCDAKNIQAQVKLLGMSVAPVILEKGVKYRLGISDTNEYQFVSDDEKQHIEVPESAIEVYVYNEHLKIINVINNKYVAKPPEYKFDDSYFLYAHKIYRMSSFFTVLVIALLRSYKNTDIGNIQGIIRLTGSQYLIKTDNMYFRFPLSGEPPIAIDEATYLKLRAKCSHFNSDSQV